MKTEPNEQIAPKISSDYAHIDGVRDRGYTQIKQTGGLTKREYYAGLAMQGIVANSNMEICDKTTVNGGWLHPDTAASLSVQLADALIAALNK